MAADAAYADPLTRLRAALAERYRITGEVGSGGMATVYAAEDIRHTRRVAIKVLRPELSAILGAERFLNEIRVTATLQHPHILQLLDSGDAGGLLYYIMPFVEGESLRVRLQRERQLPIADAVRIAREVAEALHYAHRHGVIHRDVKPENILLHDGRPVVADFGIALAVRNAGGTRLTETGLSLGTPSYMSPEQASGEREVDARTDVYSLGCVLYEMLAGEPPHTAPTVAALMIRVMTERPRPIQELRDTVPDSVADATHTALAKIPADRFGSAAELAQALGSEHATVFRATDLSAQRTASRRLRLKPRWRLVAMTAFLTAVGATSLTALMLRPRATTSPPTRLSLLVPSSSRGAALGLARQVAISPEGDRVIYPARLPAGDFGLYSHMLDAAEPAMIMRLGVTGTAAAPHVFMSPDGRHALYSNRELIYELPLNGGTPRQLDFASTPFLAWQKNGTVWYTDAARVGLYRHTPKGDSLVMAAADGSRPVIQQILPDDRTALLVLFPFDANAGSLHAFDLVTGRRRQILDHPVVEARYGFGHLVYALPDNSLKAARFDSKAARVVGTPATIARDVAVTNIGLAHFAVARNGTVAYTPNQPAELALLDRSGGVRLAVSARRNYHAPRFAPDGKRIAMDIQTPEGRDVWLLDLEQRTQTRVTFDGDGHDPVWTSDGRGILYVSRKTGVLGVNIVRPGSSAPADSIYASTQLGWTGERIPGSEDLVTVVVTPKGSDIVRIGKGGTVRHLVASPFEDAWPTLSPDGRWLAYVSTKSGQPEVYVRSLVQEGEHVTVSQNGGSEPVWSRDGRELFYRSTATGEPMLMAARVTAAPEFRVLSRTALFPITIFDPAQPHANYDVSPDGRGFAMVRREEAMRIVVLQNVPELVRRGAP